MSNPPSPVHHRSVSQTTVCSERGIMLRVSQVFVVRKCFCVSTPNPCSLNPPGLSSAVTFRMLMLRVSLLWGHSYFSSFDTSSWGCWEGLETLGLS